MQFQSNSCCCGQGKQRLALFEASDCNFASTTVTADVFRCESCGSIFPGIFPSAESIQDTYRRYYTHSPKRGGTARLVVWRVVDMTRSTYLNRSIPYTCRRLLDFGAGSCDYLRRIRSRAPEVSLFGTDVTHPGETATLGIIWIDPEQLQTARDEYDWITVGHVIEHMPDPRETLKLLGRLVSKGGGIWVATPNARSFLFEGFGRWARDVDFPRHRQIFSMALIGRWLETLGFSVQRKAPPRLNAVLNFASCARNLFATNTVSTTKKARLMWVNSWRLVLHLLQSSRKRTEEAPELVLVATKRRESSGERGRSDRGGGRE